MGRAEATSGEIRVGEKRGSEGVVMVCGVAGVGVGVGVGVLAELLCWLACGVELGVFRALGRRGFWNLKVDKGNGCSVERLILVRVVRQQVCPVVMFRSVSSAKER